MKVSTLASAALLASSASAMPGFWKRKLVTEVVTFYVTEAGPPVTIPADGAVQKQAAPTAAQFNYQDWIAKIREDMENRRKNRPTPTYVTFPDSPKVSATELPKPEPKPEVEEPKVEPTPSPEPKPEAEEPKVEPSPEPVPEVKTPVKAAPTTTKVAVVIPTPKVEEQTPQEVGSSTTDQFAKVALDTHNKFRALHSANPLVWDEGLAATALKWATTNGCKMEHSSSSFRNGAGENLYARTGMKAVYGTNADPVGGITAWYNEWPAYAKNPGTFTSGTGHFTQVVWKATTKLGCAMPICNMPGLGNNAGFLVCHYASAGNYMGQFNAQVQPSPNA